MTRKEELQKIFEKVDDNTKTLINNLIDEVCFLEEQLIALKKLPFIKVHPENNNLQKQTIAGKQYKDLCQAYNNCLKILLGCMGTNVDDETSVLKSYLKSLRK